MCVSCVCILSVCSSLKMHVEKIDLLFIPIKCTRMTHIYIMTTCTRRSNFSTNWHTLEHTRTHTHTHVHTNTQTHTQTQIKCNATTKWQCNQRMKKELLVVVYIKSKINKQNINRTVNHRHNHWEKRIKLKLKRIDIFNRSTSV